MSPVVIEIVHGFWNDFYCSRTHQNLLRDFMGMIFSTPLVSQSYWLVVGKFTMLTQDFLYPRFMTSGVVPITNVERNLAGSPQISSLDLFIWGWHQSSKISSRMIVLYNSQTNTGTKPPSKLCSWQEPPSQPRRPPWVIFWSFELNKMFKFHFLTADLLWSLSGWQKKAACHSKEWSKIPDTVRISWEEHSVHRVWACCPAWNPEPKLGTPGFSQNGAVLKWSYPKMDGLWWKLLLKMDDVWGFPPPF